MQLLEVDESLRELPLAARATPLQREVHVRLLLVAGGERPAQALEVAVGGRRGQRLRELEVEALGVLVEGPRHERPPAIKVEHVRLDPHLHDRGVVGERVRHAQLGDVDAHGVGLGDGRFDAAEGLVREHAHAQAGRLAAALLGRQRQLDVDVVFALAQQRREVDEPLRHLAVGGLRAHAAARARRGAAARLEYKVDVRVALLLAAEGLLEGGEPRRSRRRGDGVREAEVEHPAPLAAHLGQRAGGQRAGHGRAAEVDLHPQLRDGGVALHLLRQRERADAHADRVGRGDAMEGREGRQADLDTADVAPLLATQRHGDSCEVAAGLVQLAKGDVADAQLAVARRPRGHRRHEHVGVLRLRRRECLAQRVRLLATRADLEGVLEAQLHPGAWRQPLRLEWPAADSEQVDLDPDRRHPRHAQRLGLELQAANAD